MSRRLVLISFTPKDSPGGVPRWNRDFISGFPDAVHYSWWDCPLSKFDEQSSEWDKAFALNTYLRKFGKISPDDIVLVDGFWGKGLEDFPNVVSVCHGIWSHLTKEDVDIGKKPDFPVHHAVQVGYRRGHLDRGGRLVAVSRFIQDQMRLQWGFESYVINNAIDIEKFRPATALMKGQVWDDSLLIVHGVNDRSNPVKGWDHIQYLIDNIKDLERGVPGSVNIMSLDEAYESFGRDMNMTKYETLAMADLVVIPSSYEGNSYFALEAMSCDVPVFAYSVGLFHEISEREFDDYVGIVDERRYRDKDSTFDGVFEMLEKIRGGHRYQPRSWMHMYSLDAFHREWRKYLKREFDYAVR